MGSRIFAYDVCVVGGCGRVGLPLAILFAERGLRTLIYDVNTTAVASVNAGKFPYRENNGDEHLRAVIGAKLHCTADLPQIAQAHQVIVTIGTPVDEHSNPHLTPMVRCIEAMLPYVCDDQTMIMRSTVMPGTVEHIARVLTAHGKKTLLAFCPERVAEGAAFEEITSLPQIVSGTSVAAEESAAALFRHLTPDIIVVPPLEAELTKLFCNVWRYMLFATANQFYMIATDRGADFRKIRHAMRHKYPRSAQFPTAGFAAGPCLFKDTMQLSAFYRHNFFLGHAAMLVNEGLPDHLRDQLKSTYDLPKTTVGILGMAFKPEVDDIRESLAFKLKKLLLFENATVLCSDAYWKDPSCVSTEELLQHSDVIVIGCPHHAYRTLDFGDTPVLDLWEMQ